MNYKLNKEQSTVNITVTVKNDEWEKELQEAYERTKDKYEVQGFRKGKAPRKQIELAYGSNVFFEEALENFCSNSYSEILRKEEDLHPVAYPRMAVQKADEKGLEILFSVDVMPEVELGKYTGLEIEKAESNMTEDDIAHEIEHQLEHQREYSAKKENVEGRAVQNGDIANIDFCGKVDGVAFEGGTATGYDLAVGSKTFIEGFEDQVVGMNIGEERDINVTFPEAYHSKDLSGKPAVFTVKLNSISVKVLPELTDEWASDVSEFETLAEYKESLGNDIKAKVQKELETKEESDLISAIADNTKIDIPHSMIDSEVEYMMQSYSQKLSYQGMTLEDYLKYIGRSMEDFQEQCHQEAHISVKARLVLQAIVAKENIKVTDEELEAKLNEMATSYGKTIEEIKKEIDEHNMTYLRNDILTDKVFAFLKENNKFVDKKSK